ncbi:uncharacterized protein THITE_2011836, partial [Thermothielavioides terrestris NRRL 8126]
LDKPVITPPFSEAAQELDLENELPVVSWRHEPWEPNWLPEACVTEANHTGFRAADFEAVEVWYTDCAASWTVCRHKRADESWLYVLDTLGRIPVGMRQYISNAVIVPRPAHSAVRPPKRLPYAYARPALGVLTFMPSYFTPGVILHETGHLLDVLCPALTTTIPNTDATAAFSHSALWQTALAASPALPTRYAATSLAESFADAVRWAVSAVAHGPRGGLADYSPGWAGCAPLVHVVRALLEGVIWPASGRCEGRVKGG